MVLFALWYGEDEGITKQYSNLANNPVVYNKVNTHRSVYIWNVKLPSWIWISRVFFIFCLLKTIEFVTFSALELLANNCRYKTYDTITNNPPNRISITSSIHKFKYFVHGRSHRPTANDWEDHTLTACMFISSEMTRKKKSLSERG